jgi:hypothetical protein
VNERRERYERPAVARREPIAGYLLRPVPSDIKDGTG